MKFEPRQYQQDCVTAWVDQLKAGLNPVIAVPTGAGKTVILCGLVNEWIELYPDANILILSHTREIISQDYKALREFFPSFGTGIYSAGLGKKQIRKVTIGGIQSVYKHPELFTGFDICIIDEAHTINHKSAGMYRTFLKCLGIQVAGMSATIFRMGYGHIYKGDDALFDSLAYDLTSIRNFNKLVKDGYLTSLISKTTEFGLDSSKVRKTAGDYNIKHLAQVHDRWETTLIAVDECIKYGKNYKKWLVFAIDIDHANHIAKCLSDKGVPTGVLHSRMTEDREDVLEDFKDGKTRALVSVGMVTTGFDAPNVDLIVLLRPTLSTVLHVQMVGRGLRVYPDKKHCLVLDFAGNTLRLGPINNPVIPKKKKKGKGKAPAKTCPACKAIAHASARYCDICGHEFQFVNKLTTKAGKADIVITDSPIWQEVTEVRYQIHKKVGKPNSLRVSYRVGMRIVNHYICLDHGGYAKQKADAWVAHKDPTCTIFTVDHVYNRRDMLKVPTHIKISYKGKYPEILKEKFDAIKGPDFAAEDHYRFVGSGIRRHGNLSGRRANKGGFIR